MEELIDVFANNNILILGIVLFIFGLILLGYLLTLILSSKKNKKEVVEEIKEESVEKIEEDNGGPEPEKYYKIGPFKVTATNKRNNLARS